MDTISITGLTVFAHHGVLPHETALGQRFVIDLSIGCDTKTAGVSDELSDTLDYGRIASDVANLATARPVKLIETLAENIAELVLNQPGAQTVTVTVKKPSAPLAVLADHVAVTIVRP